MKNVMIYINPRKDFDEECKVTIKIQIENSLDLGWERKDILLVTNFPYKHSGITALEVSDENYSPFFPPVSKINTIVDLFEKGLIEKGQLYWFHDIDVYQNVTITESELELDDVDLGLCDKGRMPRWGTGSMFFKESSKDIFVHIKEVANRFKINEEPALMALTTNNILWATETRPEETIGNHIIPFNVVGTENINERVKKINISYNFAGWNIRSVYGIAVKPIKAVHFHPFNTDLYPGSCNVLDFFMYGKNKINTVLMSESLINVFNKYGIK